MNQDVVITDREDSFFKVKKFFYLFVKRLFDIFISIFGLILLLPVSIIVKISYLLNGDFHSIFYYHNRIGKNGKLFKLYKFRSMVYNADEVLDRILNENETLREEYNTNKKFKNDPRITKVGKVLRKSSLDELPQFINVFLGDMSLIGNRPYLPREKKDMGNYYDSIISSKPGLTGYWQVHGRSDVSFKRRLELEKYYSENCNILLDLSIFFKTFKVVLFGRGAK